ncbi:hypothetical protein HC931_11745 [Candidatus Gracilibacteria bacterium]|nr:hypothetical protein [Candidatus Gracilibacteria bacterium]NJM89826.1 hypothetical protein [Hydrococcus sp. RU_2_2]
MKLEKLLANLDNRWLYPIVIFIVGISVYSAILIVSVPSKLNLLLATNNSTFLFIAIASLLYLAYYPSGAIGTLTSFSGTLALFAVELSRFWRNGLSDGMTVAGFLPSSDAINYYTAALNLLEGKDLANTTFLIASWRPIFGGVLATLLGLTEQNLQITLAILVLINAIACFLLAREVQCGYGIAPAVLIVTLIFLFYKPFIGQVMTEHWGIALGTIGLAVLLRGTLKEHQKLCLLGIFLLTLALNARVGALFILPVLIFWGAWAFRGKSLLSMRFAIAAFSAVLLGFILNSLVFKVASTLNAISNANFFYTLYGLVVDGNWATIRADYPEILQLVEPERSHRVREIAMEAFRANPFGLVTGAMRAWQQFLFKDFVFSFVKSSRINFLLQLSSLIAIVNCYRQRQQPISSLMLAMTIGILLSVPFVPPWDAGTRPYAATIPLFSLFPVLGIAFFAQKMEWHKLLQIPQPVQQPQILLVVGISLAVLSIGGPITTALASHPPQFSQITCPASTEAIYFRNSAGSSINLVPDRATKRSYVPNIRISDFKNNIRRLERSDYVETAKELAKLDANTTLRNTTDIKSGKLVWLISDSRLIPKEKGIVGVCGRPTTNPAIAKYGRTYHGPLPVFLFYADSMTVVSR